MKLSKNSSVPLSSPGFLSPKHGFSVLPTGLPGGSHRRLGKRVRLAIKDISGWEEAERVLVQHKAIYEGEEGLL